MTDTDSESILKTSKWKNFVIFIIVNHSTSERQPVWHVFQQCILPLLNNATFTTRLHKSVGTAENLLSHKERDFISTKAVKDENILIVNFNN